ncbi:MAG: hypothetical protein JXA14_16780 [Anaerolineae bacterium]|nr:hypothetical protein [Anaerolineae bacterium]
MSNWMSDWLAQAPHDLEHARHAAEERNVFTTFASSRFVDREAVIERLRARARRLKAEQRALC